MTSGARRPSLRFPALPHLRLDPGCVVSYCPIASSIGARVLHGGGNAVDAAVSTALALAVTYPQAGNIGGGGLMLIHDAGKVHCLDYRERAPARVTPELYDDEGSDTAKSALGALSVAVPGTIAGLAEAHAKHGRKPWREIVELVVPLAERGVWLTTRQSSTMRLYSQSLQRFESTRRYYMGEDGEVLPPGTLFMQQDLAHSLRLIAEHGPGAFYEGEIADKIVAQMAKSGGVLAHDDLASYRPIWREPLCRRYQDHDVYLPGLPSAGGLVASFALGCATATDIASMRYGSPQWVLTWARIFRAAYNFANQQSGDPDHIPPDELAATLAMASRDLTATELEQLESVLLPTEPVIGDAAAAVRPSTTHFSIIDRDGMAVSNTYSVNTLFGSKLAVDGAGFLLNNTIADFRIAAGPNWYGLLQGERNRLAPHRRPASSMTPTIVTRNGQIVMVIGGSGGPRIPSAIAQVTSSVFGSGLSLSESVRRPRVHHQVFPDDVVLEKGFPKRTVERLNKEGYKISVVNALGMVAAIRRRLDDNEISAVLDQRFG
ncbi:MAG: gamma-glutamyltransferase, partial [Deltaproteobacteria bacterium]|nr:gamma-glutamyltransferase [Deltaproteobacteria bacterium]